MLPVLTYAASAAVRRCARSAPLDVDLATERPRQLRLDGAAFPWRTIAAMSARPTGRGHAAFHVNADIADAVLRYLRQTATTSRARGGARAAGGDRAAMALAGPPRPGRRVPHRRGHRARRVLGHRRRQRLHQPDGRPEPARRGGHRRATARRRRALGSATRRSPRGATRRARSPCPRRRARGPPAGGGPRATAVELRGDGADEYPLLLHPRTRPLSQAGRQAGRPRARPVRRRRSLHGAATRRAPSRTTSR